MIVHAVLVLIATKVSGRMARSTDSGFLSGGQVTATKVSGGGILNTVQVSLRRITVDVTKVSGRMAKDSGKGSRRGQPRPTHLE